MAIAFFSVNNCRSKLYLCTVIKTTSFYMLNRMFFTIGFTCIVFSDSLVDKYNLICWTDQLNSKGDRKSLVWSIKKLRKAGKARFVQLSYCQRLWYLNPVTNGHSIREFFLIRKPLSDWNYWVEYKWVSVPVYNIAQISNLLLCTFGVVVVLLLFDLILIWCMIIIKLNLSDKVILFGIHLSIKFSFRIRYVYAL